MTSETVQITLLTQSACTYCEHAKTVLARVGHDFDIDVDEIALDSDEGRSLASRHAVMFAPGVLVDGRPFGYGRLSERKLRKQLARPRVVSPDRQHE